MVSKNLFASSLNNGVILITSDESEQLGKQQCFRVFPGLFVFVNTIGWFKACSFLL